MGILMWDLVDQFYAITYSGSPRIEQFTKDLEYWGIPSNKLTWNVAKKMDCDNCLLASASKNHCDAYRKAKISGYKNIVIFEDDIIVYSPETTIPKINEKTNYFIRNYPEYDILYYGYFPFYINNESLDNGILKMYGVLQHAYLINERFYSKFIDLDIPIISDICFTPCRMPIDWWALNLQIKYQKSYGLYPQMVYQNNSPFLKKGNNNATISKIICDSVTDTMFYGDKVLLLLIIGVVIYKLGKIK